MTRKSLMQLILAGALLAAPMAAHTTAVDPESRAATEMEKKVRKELVMLPFYSVFDHFAFRLDNGVVTLTGQVSRPTLKSDAGRVVARIEGVTRVDNQIEVLPLSPYDNSVRIAVLRAIYGQPALQRYGLGALPSIHIIVKNGVVTLEGVVDNKMDHDIAFLRANGVGGVFKVNNNLRIARS